MNLIMIAVVYKGKEVIGFRMFDTNAKDKKFMDVPYDSVKGVLTAGQVPINNLGLSDGKIIGTNGILERYPRINSQGILLDKVSPLIIINRLGEVGYTVVDFNGCVKKARTSDVVLYAKQYGISNGKVVIKDNVEFISAITGSYPVADIPASKVKNSDNDAVKIHIALNHNRGADSVYRNADTDVSVEIEENDVFSAMTEEQTEVLKDYYVWYTVDKYKSLAKSVRLNLAVGKAEKLAELRGTADWEFGGVWDSGYIGASHCELGHPLRYEYYAVPADDRDNKEARIVFGETCASDFFRISTDEMKNLVKTRTIMSDEIKLMADILTNEQEQFYKHKVIMLYKVLAKLGTQENIKEVFGYKVGNTLIQFIITKLPFPMSLVLEASKKIYNRGAFFFKKVFPEYEGFINEVYSDSYKGIKFFDGAKRYLDFIVNNKIEGEYAYNPLDESSVKRRDIGAYNKNTRYLRKRLLQSIQMSVLVSEFTYEELEAFLHAGQTFLENRTILEGRLKNNIRYAYDVTNDNKFELASKFAKEDGLSVDEKNERLLVSNTLAATEKTVGYHYDNRFWYCDEDDIYSFTRHRSIVELDNKLRKYDKCQSRIMNEFSDYCLNKESNLKAHKEEEERKEAERQAEEERKRFEQVQAESKRSRERGEIDKISKANAEENDNVARLKNLIANHPEIPVDDGIEIAIAILDKGIPYSELSSKQRWRVDYTIKYYENIIEGKDPNEDLNKTYKLEEHPEIKEKVSRIIDLSDEPEIKSVLKDIPNVVKIAYSIKTRGKASDKQLKCINKAIDILDQA